MDRVGAEQALPDPRAARRAFDRAARTFANASVVHDEARHRLLERLDYVRLYPRLAVDLGCGPGAGARALAARYPNARVLAVDTSLPMLRAVAAAATEGTAAAPRIAAVAADAHRLPLPNGTVHLTFANMLLPWGRPERVFAEAARVLTDGGLLLFSTLGPDTLEQVRRAWLGTDDRIHVHASFDMHDLGDLAVAAGLAEPVVDVDRMELTYMDVASLVRDLRDCGASNVAAGRRRTLTGARRWARFASALEAGRRDDGRFPVTVELILGAAWGRGRAPGARRDPSGDVSVAIEDIGFARGSRR